MIYMINTHNTQYYKADSAGELVLKMMLADPDEYEDWQDFTKDIAARVLLDCGEQINFMNAEAFIDDLINHGYISTMEIQ